MRRIALGTAGHSPWVAAARAHSVEFLVFLSFDAMATAEPMAPNRVEEWFQMVPHLISEEGRERLQLRGWSGRQVPSLQIWDVKRILLHDAPWLTNHIEREHGSHLKLVWCLYRATCTRHVSHKNTHRSAKERLSPCNTTTVNYIAKYYQHLPTHPTNVRQLSAFSSKLQEPELRLKLYCR